MAAPSVRALALGALLVLLAAATVVTGAGPPAQSDSPAAANPPVDAAIPLDGPWLYEIEYLGLTCGYLTLESRREIYEGRDAYHIIMRARTSSFFDHVYRVDGRLDSWTDAATLSGIAYESVITEKKKTSISRYRVDNENQVVTRDKDGKVREIPFEGSAGLDPLAFLFRARTLAAEAGESFELRLLTDDGSLDTRSEVGDLRRRSTYEGRRDLLPVEPQPASGEMFSRQGQFVMWIDPSPERTLYRFWFKLAFGKLSARLTGPAPEDGNPRPDEG